MTIDTHKQNVLKVRMDGVTLQLLEQARQYIGLDKSKFIRQSIREKATHIISEHEQTQFTTQDWQQFFDLLDNPPETTARMKKGLKTYEQILANEV
jgi:uncharacterized protein (DUF1778 family)